LSAADERVYPRAGGKRSCLFSGSLPGSFRLWSSSVWFWRRIPAAAAKDPAAVCSASKRKAAGKKGNAKLKCVAKAAKENSPVDPTCMTKAEDKFDLAFTKADDKGGCTATDDTATIEALVDVCVRQIRTQLGIPGDPSSRSLCSSSELKAAGKKLSGKMNCYAKAAKKFQPVDPTCLSKAESKFMTAFGNAELKGDCYTMSHAATVESIVDDCVGDLVEELPLPVPVCGFEPGEFAGITAQHNDTRRNASPVRAPRSIPCAGVISSRAMPRRGRRLRLQPRPGPRRSPRGTEHLRRRELQGLPTGSHAGCRASLGRGGRQLQLLDQYLRPGTRAVRALHADRLA
jgi:hypothetical protein